METPGLDLSLIIISYNVRELLRDCLASIWSSLEASGGWPVAEIFVVDNHSGDGSVEMLEQLFPQVQVLANPTNPGFAAANNQALARARGRYLLLLNPDTEVRGQALATLVSYLDSHEQIGVVGPQLLNSDGTVQSSRRRFPTLATALYESTVLQTYFPKHRLLDQYYMADQPDERAHEVDWLVGACLLVRREVVRDVGPLDADFFMYWEELDWCKRIKAAGWRVVYLPTAQVVHHYGKSSEQNMMRRDIAFTDSKYKYVRKHYGLASALFLRTFIFSTFLFQLLRESATYLVVAHNREMRRRRLAGLWGVLCWHLRRTAWVGHNG